MGKKKNREMLFWTKGDYLKFANSMMDKPMSYYAFEMLYWCGIREGELFALTSEDFDESKPSPDCYLKGAARFGATPEDCVVFEDSFNGLKSGRAAGMFVVGLSTTNEAEKITPLADVVIKDYLVGIPIKPTHQG